MQRFAKSRLKPGRHKPSNSSLIKVNIGGTDALVGREQLQGHWTSCHGTAVDGTQVKSLQVQFIGDKGLVMKPGGEIADYNLRELEVAAVKIAQMRGYKVIHPNGDTVQP